MEDLNLVYTIPLWCIAIISLFYLAIVNIAELSFFRLSAKELNKIKKQSKPNYRRVLRLIEKPKRLLASLYVAQMFFIVMFTTAFFLALAELDIVAWLYASMNITVQPVLYNIVFIVLVALMLLLLGIIIPRVHAANRKFSLSLFAAIFMGPIDFIFGGLGQFLAEHTNFLYSKMGMSHAKEMTTEELQEAIEEGRNHAATIEEVNIFKSILKFDEIQVKQIMKPRLDVTALNAELDVKEVKDIIVEHGYSRMPVFEEHLDKIIGIIHTKDLLPHTENEAFDWKTVMRSAVYVPETKYAESLLKEFQQSRNHIAIVVDEFGGTSGLVTLEDIMEEIIGDIQDEFDDDDIVAKKINASTYLFEGKTSINDACRFASLAVDTFDTVKGESDSVAGLVLELAGKFPMVNERVSHAQYQFTVLSLEGKRIQKIKMFIQAIENDA